LLIKLKSILPKGSIPLAIISGSTIILGFFREAVFAYYFGASSELDAFLAALTIPKIIVVQVTAISVAAILPYYVRAKSDTKNLLIKNWSSFLLFSLLLLTIMLSVFPTKLMFILAPGLPDDLKNKAGQWLRILLPYFFIMSLGSIFKIVLDSNKEFSLPALSKVIVLVSVILSCIVGAKKFGVRTLLIGFSIGAIIAFTLQYIKVNKYHKKLFVASPRHFDFKSIPIASVGLVLINTFFDQLYILFDRGFASTLSAGSISSLNYANALISAPAAIISTMLATTLFPVLAEYMASDKITEAYKLTFKWITLVVTFGGLISLLIIIFRYDIIRILFQRGEFDTNAVHLTASVLSVLPLMIVFSSSSAIINRLLFVYNEYKFIAILSIATAFLKFIFNYIFMKHFGIMGLALATVTISFFATLSRGFRSWHYFKMNRISV